MLRIASLLWLTTFTILLSLLSVICLAQPSFNTWMARDCSAVLTLLLPPPNPSWSLLSCERSFIPPSIPRSCVGPAAQAILQEAFWVYCWWSAFPQHVNHFLYYTAWWSLFSTKQTKYPLLSRKWYSYADRKSLTRPSYCLCACV